ncbi:MMPL family transporter [Bacillus aquiflavi]|uniref:MMPL family transporter n=1 Tax=Bacillus aquiflavi TaxID=2672567 RepID=A0A6B3W1S9_9BACI|nr:MMPL family transporter [Bacillus aquiflavi]MBA4536959.1 MMPL family transporter [Bacillus aquiflavi]NEY82655.1 MMPL family transporter [Bacillus aquiflavi]UAC47775.1 MMPL family transporter [Bacillus aquiflavi]
MRRLNKLSTLLMKKPIKVTLVSIFVIIILFIGAKNIQMATGNETLINTDTTVYKDNEKLEEEFGGESIIVMYEGQNLLNLTNLHHMKGLENQLQTMDEIYSIFSPVTVVEQLSKRQFEQYKKGITEMSAALKNNQHINTMLAHSDILKPGLPENKKTLNDLLYDNNGKLRDLFSEVITDDEHLMMIIKFQGGIEDSSKSEIVSQIKTYLADHELKATKTFVSGKPVLDDAIRSSMQDSMKKMMLLSIFFMIIILSLTFKVSWRLLPLGMILIAIFGTIGLMGWLKIPITMVSMAVFPILIGLGIDYAIQLQNRYTEEMKEEDSLEQ